VNFNKLIARVRLLLTSPKTEWPVIANEPEPATVASLYTGYIMILAAIPAVCTFIKSAFIGYGWMGIGAYRVGVSAGITAMVMTYVLSLVAVFVLALIIEALAPTFGGEKNRVQALKTAAYAYTAAWVAGLGMLLPWLGFLIAIVGAIYSIYLLYLGLPHTMKSPPDRSAGYTAVSVVVAIVLSWIIGLVTAGLMGSAIWGAAAMGAATSGSFDKGSPLGRMETWSKKVEAAGKNMEAAQKSGSQQDQSQAMSQMMGAVLGGGSAVAEALAPDRLKAFIPDELNGLARTEVAAERNSAIGLQVSSAHGTYSDGAGRNLRLEITDAGGASGFMALAGWANVESEAERSDGYERTRKEGNRMVHEEWNRHSDGGGNGEYSTTVADRFMVKVSGDASGIDDLKGALASVNLSGLEALKNEGVKTE
jgi:hypothetical protein